MMVEFCCTKCGHVKIEPAQLHEDPRNPQTCTACAVKFRPAPPPPPTTEYRKRPGGGYAFGMMGLVVVLVSLGFFWGWIARGGA